MEETNNDKNKKAKPIMNNKLEVEDLDVEDLDVEDLDVEDLSKIKNKEIQKERNLVEDLDELEELEELDENEERKELKEAENKLEETKQQSPSPSPSYDEDPNEIVKQSLDNLANYISNIIVEKLKSSGSTSSKTGLNKDSFNAITSANDVLVDEQ